MIIGRIVKAYALVISCGTVGLLIALSSVTAQDSTIFTQGFRDCYNTEGLPQPCFPVFQNSVPVANITATNTCGLRQQEFCRKTSAVVGYEGGQTESCEAPRPGVENRQAHPVENIVDNDRQTWWQSDTMQDLGTERHSVNVTISLGKAHDIDLIQVFSHSLRPHSVILHKSSDFGRTWTKYQYFSRNCRHVFNMDDLFLKLRSNRYEIGDSESICTSEYSDRIPISGGRIDYSTLKHKANWSSFTENAALRQWVTATDIRLELVRMNTFGEDIKTGPNTFFGDDRDFQCYYYSIESATIGGQCKCNGHAGECVGEGSERHCVCNHNTTGPDCERCADFYVDKPWAPATIANPFACKRCQCYGHTQKCRYNSTLYLSSGRTSGGECLECQDNTHGAHCERCLSGYYRDRDEPPTERNPCKACQCKDDGTGADYCTEIGGGCTCKPNTHGPLCGRCISTAYGFGSHDEFGCTGCECLPAGTMDGSLECDNVTGQCMCKQNVEGRQCDTCKDGFYSLNASDPNGCRPCECSPIGSESPVCDKRTGVCICKEFIGGRRCDKVNSDAYIPHLDETTIEVESGAETETARFIPDFDRVNTTGKGTLRVTGPTSVSWMLYVPRSGPYRVIIRYSLENMVFWERAILTFERPNNPAGDPPDPQLCMETGNVASLQFDEPTPGQFTFHKLNNTACLRSGTLYQVTLTMSGEIDRGSPIDIDSIVLLPAPHFIDPGNITSTHGSRAPTEHDSYEDCLTARAPVAAAGEIIDECGPWEEQIAISPLLVRACDCDPMGSERNESLDRPSCMLSGGQCYCKDGVTGRQCDSCQVGFFDLGENGCTRCTCDAELSVHPNGCDAQSGQCQCLNGVDPAHGKNCEHCLESFYRQPASVGCSPCECNTNGSVNASCNEYTGQCICKEGVTGQTCDTCLSENHFLNSDGCQPCKCDANGSSSLQCDGDGVCPCRANVVGQRCRYCAPNYHGLHGDNLDGCLPCFCFGHSRQCQSSSLFTKRLLQTLTEAPENSELEKWFIVDENDQVVTDDVQVPTAFGYGVRQAYPTQELFAVHRISNPNIINTYGRTQTFNLRMEPAPLLQERERGPGDIFFISSTGQKISAKFDQEPSSVFQEHSVVLLERFWQPSLTPDEFHFFLTNVSELRIRLAYPNDKSIRAHGYLNEVQLPIAAKVEENTVGDVPWVELCSCPPQYNGSRCEFCAVGFRRETLNGNKMNSCVPCECHGHSSSCEPQTGACMSCRHNTEGYSCERCVPDFYGNATRRMGDADACQPCFCDLVGTVFVNASVAVCDHVSGQCDCKAGVTGRQCDRCQDTFYNFNDDGCQPCECHPIGAVNATCNSVSGKCECVGNVIGRACDRCPENFFNLSSGCLECPTCYGLVANATRKLRQNIANFERVLLLDLTRNAAQQTDNVMLNASLLSLLTDIKALLAMVQRSANRSSALRQPFETLVANLTKLQLQINLIRTDFESTSTGAEISLSEIGAMTTKANNLTDVVSELLIVLRVNVTALLKTARLFFTNQTDQATEVRGIANTAERVANNTANRALETEHVAALAIEHVGEADRLVEDLNRTIDNVTVEVEMLEREMKDKMLHNLEKEENHTAESQQLVNSVAKSADLIFRQATAMTIEKRLAEGQDLVKTFTMQLEMMEKGLPILREMHGGKRNDLFNLTEKAVPVISENRKLMSELRNLSQQARTLNARVRVNRRDIFGWATEMESTIKDYHDAVQADRRRAERAMKRVQTAENATKHAKEVLNQVNTEMNTTRSSVQNALSLATNTYAELLALSSKVQLQFLADVNPFKDTAATLAANVARLNQEATSIFKKAAGHYSTAAAHRDESMRFYQTVQQAATDIQTIQEGLDSTLLYLERLSLALADWRIDFMKLSNRLNTVKQQLEQVTALHNRASFESLITALEEEETQLDKEVQDRSAMVEQLKKQLGQVIRNDASLPDRCTDMYGPPAAPSQNTPPSTSESATTSTDTQSSIGGD